MRYLLTSVAASLLALPAIADDGVLIVTIPVDPKACASQGEGLALLLGAAVNPDVLVECVALPPAPPAPPVTPVTPPIQADSVLLVASEPPSEPVPAAEATVSEPVPELVAELPQQPQDSAPVVEASPDPSPAETAGADLVFLPAAVPAPCPAA